MRTISTRRRTRRRIPSTLPAWDIYVRWGNSELPLEVNSGITNKELKELIKIKTGGRLTPERCKLMWHEREIDEYGEEIHLQDIGVVDRISTRPVHL